MSQSSVNTGRIPTREELLPPPPVHLAHRVLMGAGGLVLIAALLGLAPLPVINSARVLFCFVGIVAAAVAVSWRAKETVLWLAAGAIALLGYIGLPSEWDSYRLVALVSGVIAIVIGLAYVLPAKYKMVAVSAVVLFQFSAILAAVTWPDTHGSSAPYLTNQLAMRVYLPYYRFMYLGNAYHFYSPNPGPASHLFILVEGETDEPADPDPKTGQVPLAADGTPARKRRSEWIDIPKRNTHFRDPLGLTYYRRLSITELVSYSTPGGVNSMAWERNLAIQNRRNNELGLAGTPVPGAVRPFDMDMTQYRVPRLDIRRGMHPSYSRHIAIEFSGPRTVTDGKSQKVVQFTVKSIKLFQVEHSIITPQDFLGYTPSEAEKKASNGTLRLSSIPTNNPNAPTLYMPFYLGEYDASGTLLKPDDPLLYWMVPIVRDPRDPSKYIDYMSQYAGFEFDWKDKE
jgi:hypothetical protein